MFANTTSKAIFAPLITIGFVAQLNRASDYGSEGYRFESCRDHKKKPPTKVGGFLFLTPNQYLYIKPAFHHEYQATKT